MVFNSITFVYYFLPITIGVFYLLRKYPRVQNVWLLACSFLFYGWCNIEYLAFLLVFGLMNYWFGRVLYLCSENQQKSVKYLVLFPILLLDLLSLFVVKYLNFSIIVFNTLSPVYIEQVTGIIVPLGISFLVFSMISYLVDIYWRRIQPLESIVDFFLYLSFFPKVSQGPITRCEQLQDPLKSRTVSLDQFVGGFADLHMVWQKKS